MMSPVTDRAHLHGHRLPNVCYPRGTQLCHTIPQYTDPPFTTRIITENWVLICCTSLLVSVHNGNKDTRVWQEKEASLSSCTTVGFAVQPIHCSFGLYKVRKKNPTCKCWTDLTSDELQYTTFTYVNVWSNAITMNIMFADYVQYEIHVYVVVSLWEQLVLQFVVDWQATPFFHYLLINLQFINLFVCCLSTFYMQNKCVLILNIYCAQGLLA